MVQRYAASSPKSLASELPHKTVLPDGQFTIWITLELALKI
ncbi:hypothetical protein HMPREF0454_00994 [Hafnia alvei ATCC 51873]|uniref:Uncharacterized protein n=1 Tax=Hafnia alvei ATCC 51873 TaxID=1002364 RepID=G9Y369_HAFAL|nr:hypothetical protein HMPREF0454_00994 [Hafnia alvei ATCC 51873]